MNGIETGEFGEVLRRWEEGRCVKCQNPLRSYDEEASWVEDEAPVPAAAKDGFILNRGLIYQSGAWHDAQTGEVLGFVGIPKERVVVKRDLERESYHSLLYVYSEKKALFTGLMLYTPPSLKRGLLFENGICVGECSRHDARQKIDWSHPSSGRWGYGGGTVHSMDGPCNQTGKHLWWVGATE
jgi:hypothetical protein